MKDGIEADATVVDPRAMVADAPLPAEIGIESFERPAGTVVVVDEPVVSVTVADDVARTTTHTVSESCRCRLSENAVI